MSKDRIQMQYRKLHQSNRESKQWTHAMIVLVERYCKTCMFSSFYLQVAMTFICTLEKRFLTLLSLTQISISSFLLTISWEWCKQLHDSIMFISDYDVEIWWNNQKSYLVKFRKLQNAALQKILSAFQTLLIDAMQIEVEISSMKMQLDQKYKNYAIQIVKFLKKHFIRKRTFILYSSQYFIELNLNLNASKYLN